MTSSVCAAAAVCDVTVLCLPTHAYVAIATVLVFLFNLRGAQNNNNNNTVGATVYREEDGICIM